MAINILTASGGEINLIPAKNGLSGHQLVLHVDQTSNIKSGDDDASIAINPDECKKLIDMLNEYISFVEGKNYVAIIDYTNSGEDGVIRIVDDGSISNKDIIL